MTSKTSPDGNTLYDVLKVKKNSTQKEIKEAFIKLSKELHPDKNEGNHKDFVKLNEAYTILSKDSSRNKYDQQISRGQYNPSYPDFKTYQRPNPKHSYRPHTNYEYDFHQFYEARPSKYTKVRPDVRYIRNRRINPASVLFTTFVFSVFAFSVQLLVLGLGADERRLHQFEQNQKLLEIINQPKKTREEFIIEHSQPPLEDLKKEFKPD